MAQDISQTSVAPARASDLDGVTGRIELAAHADSVGRARHLVADALSDSELAREDLDVIVLLTSELVTNAILHAGSTIQLTVRESAGEVRVEVSDASGRQPILEAPSPMSNCGRGLAMVNALADDWSVTAHDSGKTVWFRVLART